MFVLFIIVGIFILVSGLALIVLVTMARPSPETQLTGQPVPRGLFDIDAPASGVPTADREPENHLALVRSGDWGVLDQIWHSSGAGPYRAMLDATLDQLDGDKVKSLVAHISSSSELRASAGLASRVLEGFKNSPSITSATEALHLASLSDDAVLYDNAVEAVIDEWRRGNLGRLSSNDLLRAIESQFWVLAPEARQGGAGFQLKRKLVGLRRELAAAGPSN
jgi:hypothetical protein